MCMGTNRYSFSACTPVAQEQSSTRLATAAAFTNIFTIFALPLIVEFFFDLVELRLDPDFQAERGGDRQRLAEAAVQDQGRLALSGNQLVLKRPGVLGQGILGRDE